MKRSLSVLSVTLFVATLIAFQAYASQDKALAPRLEGIGSYHYPISTKSAKAQQFFDQGMILSYGFNHAEAERSFREASRLDPECAMCYWGAALVLGPNINLPMNQEAAPQAYEAIQKALALAGRTSEKERALIDALAKRYSDPTPQDRSQLDQAYADAMRQVAKRYPDDVDVKALFAESLMDLHPWDYWTPQGEAKPWTPEIIAALESALEKSPDHPGAIHFYIHTMEASPRPQTAEPYADRLAKLPPGTSHLAHMPSHIYIRVGRYHDATLANERSLVADQAYITQCRAQGVYPFSYMPHNTHFLWYAALMSGQNALARQAGQITANQINTEKLNDQFWGGLQQQFTMLPIYAMTRFGQWDDILNLTEPQPVLPYTSGVWRFARGVAFAAQGNYEQAATELTELKKLASDPALRDELIWGVNSTGALLEIAAETLAGEIAARKGDYASSIPHLEKAVALEDGLTYIEPPDWPYPVRQSLGAVLLEAGKPAEAEAVYREDLRINPENGWSLFGLAESLKAQGKDAQAKEAANRFRSAWNWADVTITASRF